MTDQDFDFGIIGGGVVGCAVARRLTLAGATVVLIEKGADILSGASKGNSAILHTGFDADPGSLEHVCLRSGHAEYLAIRERMNLPLLETGAMVVAWSDEDVAKLPGIVEKAHANGISDVRMIERSEVLRREPHLTEGARAAALVPGEGIIDPWSAPLAYLSQAMLHGAEVRRGSEVTGGEFDGAVWHLETTTGPLRCRFVVNCAGLFGDQLEALLLGDASFEMRPRKGQFIVYDKAASALLKTIILPVPTERTKGVVACRTIFGNVLVGPTAEEQQSRSDASTDFATLEVLRAKAAEIVPALASSPITATYAGIRPGTERKEYRIRHEPTRNWLTIGGIRSTGLSAALGLAQHVESLLGGAGFVPRPLDNPAWPRMPMLAESGSRDWEADGNGGVVCHCELVTEREIRCALAGPLPARDLAGLKRRTRATMGRCQGFYCSNRLSEIADEHFVEPLAVGAAHA
ncbi:NAD(P)/FAD-dependent oxidoreductase [Mesorhizobium sp. KR1-2]|uniref:NAD(P)/FAD-dependent oxidoreductase n=1 Tax=Mesorhizobium sp. KR1-2 TaxID=3156609 RepID=UPI0032B4ED5F